MTDHPNVRRLKGQPDRWRRTVEREQYEEPSVAYIDVDLAAVRSALAARHCQVTIGDSITRMLDQLRSDIKASNERVGAQLAAFTAGLRRG